MSESGVIEMGAEARAQLDAGRWVQAATLFRKMEKSTSLSPNQNVYYGVALTNLNEIDNALNHFTDTALASSSRRNFVRRRAVVPQLQIKNYSNAEAVLQRLLEIAPDNVANLGSLATVFLREERDSDALGCLKKAYALNADSAALRNRLLQTHTRIGNIEDACDFALTEKHWWEEDKRFAQSCALALLDAQRATEALAAADAILAQTDCEAGAVAVAAQVYLESGHPKKAMNICRTALRSEIDGADIRFIMAKASCMMGRDTCFATHHLRTGLSLDENHFQSARRLGRLLRQSGDHKSAVSAFETAIRIDPKCMSSRIDLGRTLHLLNRYAHASDVFAVPLKKAQKAEKWVPLAISTMLAAGHTDEAESVFNAYRKDRSRTLPKTLTTGLEKLDPQIPGEGPSRARLDWAWSMTKNNTCTGGPNDRAAWERAACWGYRADVLISDWMECRPERYREILDLIDISASTQDRLDSAMSRGKGAILAASHLGPLSSGPLILKKLGVAHKWLAPLPHTSRLNRDGSLIPTGEQADLDVSVAVFRALSNGYAVANPVDGALDPSGPALSFEGCKLPFSDFAARAAHRYQSPSFFAMPVWRGRRIDLILKQLPQPQAEEALDLFKKRWTDAYSAHLRNALGLSAENLRFFGGLWRAL